MDNKEQQPGKEQSSPTTPAGSAANTQGESLDGGPEQKATTETTTAAPAKKNKTNIVRRIISHLNIYFLAFIFIAVLSAGIVIVGIQKNKKSQTNTTINTQTLDSSALDQVKNSDSTVGDAKQTLTIASNAVFSGKVLIRDSLDVAGTLKVGGALTLPGLTVSGNTSLNQVTASSLSVGSDVDVQGKLNVQKGINVTGGGTFSGPVSVPQLTVQALQLSGDLQIVRHIDAGGGTPGKSDGTALGNGGTSSISGTDTAGTLTVNTGGSPGSGCFATITFTNKFTGTPHVAITPVGSAAAGLSYYVNRTNSSMSVCTTNPAPAGQTFSFDYIVLD